MVISDNARGFVKDNPRYLILFTFPDRQVGFVSRGKGAGNFLHLSRPFDMMRFPVVSQKNLVRLKVQGGEHTASWMVGMKNSSQGLTEDILARGSPVLFKYLVFQVTCELSFFHFSQCQDVRTLTNYGRNRTNRVQSTSSVTNTYRRTRVELTESSSERSPGCDRE